MDFGQGIRKALAKITGAAIVDEAAVKELVKELQRVLITNDVEIKLVREITKKIEEKALNEKKAQSIAIREHIAKIVYDELVALLGEKFEAKIEKNQRLLMCGLYGAGKCVHPNTRIPLADGSTKTIEQLYNEDDTQELALEDGFVKEGKPIKVFGFDSGSLKVNEVIAGKIWKLKKTDPLRKITLENGSAESIETTPEHSFFTLKEGAIIQKRADNLQIGDYVAMPRQVPFAGKEWQFDILPLLPSATRVINKTEALRVKAFVISKYGTMQKALKTLEIKRPYCGITYELKRGEIDASLLNKIIKNGFIATQKEGGIKLIGGHRKTNFPRKCTPELAEFLGYFYGDGNIEIGSIHVTNCSDEIINRIIHLSQKLFEITPTIVRQKRSTLNLRAVSIASKTIVSLISNLLAMPPGAKSKTMKLPPQFLTLPEECTERFLRAYFDCDGYAANETRAIEFCTASREFAYQLRLLLLKHRINSGYAIKTIKETPYYRITLRATDAEEFAVRIGSSVPFKQNRLNKLCDIGLTQTKGQLENLHLGSLLKEIREYYGATIGEIQKYVNAYGIYESSGIISRSALKKFLKALNKTKNANNEILAYCGLPTPKKKLIEAMNCNEGWLDACLYRLKQIGYVSQESNAFQTTTNGKMLLLQNTKFDLGKIQWLKTLANSDLSFCRVKKIEENNSVEYVYDLTVEEHHNFLAEGFIVHNTTTIAKLAKFYQKSGLHVGVICGDIHRPAAFEQLKQLSEQVKCDFYGNKGQRAELIAVEGLDKLKHCDVIIYDSAGRSAFDKELAHELKHVVEKFRPTDSFLVVSADIGQVAGKQAEEFSKVAPISGVIITKMDGSGKGGGALSSVNASKSKVAFIGTGEKMDALEVFDSKKFVSNLVGFPDLEALLDKVKEASDEQSIQRVMETGKLDYESFMAQMRAMKKMGPLKQILQMIGVYDVPEDMMVKSEEKLKTFEHIVNSMTIKERRDPELMNNRSRQERIAKGAGAKGDEVRELIKQFNTISKFMTGAKKNKGLMKRMAGKLPAGFDLSKLGSLGG